MKNTFASHTLFMIYALFISVFLMSGHGLATEGTDVLSAAEGHYKKSEFLKAHRKADEAIPKLNAEAAANPALKKDLAQAYMLKARILSVQQVSRAKVKQEIMAAIMIDPRYVGSVDTSSLKPDFRETLSETKTEFIDMMKKSLFGQELEGSKPSPILQATRIEPAQQVQTAGRRHTMAVIPIILKDAYKDEPSRAISDAVMKQIIPAITGGIKNANVYVVPEDQAGILKAQLSIRDYDQFVMGPDKPVGMGDVDAKDVNTGDIVSKVGFVSLPEHYVPKFNPLYKHLHADSILLISVYNNLSFSNPYFIQVYYCFYTKQEKSKPTMRDSVILEKPDEIIPYIKRSAFKFDVYVKSLE